MGRFDGSFTRHLATMSRMACRQHKSSYKLTHPPPQPSSHVRSTASPQQSGYVGKDVGCTLEKCFFPSDSREGGGFWMVISRTFMGGYRANGAWPCASSRMVMPNDQMSARELYLQASQLHSSLYVFMPQLMKQSHKHISIASLHEGSCSEDMPSNI